ncbi:MAG: hypothetical protein ING89_09130 [Rubrivivax sp.]|nr:hypothetical protein [Rubrivivax sp.]
MNHAPCAGRRRWLLLLAGSAGAAALAGCGPGVGGSGTGLEPPPALTAALPTPSLHADGIDGRHVQAVLEGSRLRVTRACPLLQFSGRWNGLPGSPLHFEGELDGNPARPARAEVQVSGSTLVVTLRDGTGTVLLGPLALGSVMTLPPLQSCG